MCIRDRVKAIHKKDRRRNLDKSCVESGREELSKMLKAQESNNQEIEMSPQEQLEKVWSKKLIEKMRSKKKEKALEAPICLLYTSPSPRDRG
eukprot:TRINITY_DN9499_c0_g1_i1.p3 TRINITY_DN9499_c0_g1~~TRINITY_DN9499_c0_g1_i1.p3  ORF type:complete len:101 (-),score=35.37 TRINITY_DN9499_c0_g1_i1:32-307(-)